MTSAGSGVGTVNQVPLVFAQSLDITRPHVLLTEDVKGSGSLVYRYADSEDLVMLPNVPYNQPAAVRVQFMRWQADGVERQAARLKANPPFGASPEEAGRMVRSRLDRAERMRKEADRVERADRPGYPVAASRLDVDYGPNVE